MTRGLLAILCLQVAVANGLGPALRFGRTAEDVLAQCNGDCGDAVHATELFTSGKSAAEVRERCRVGHLTGTNLTSYSGFFTTDPSVQNNLFWWYFPAQLKEETETPTLVWLQGGPGGASTFGLFAEMGPYTLSPNESEPTGFTVGDRPTSWNKRYNMIFIDNPVGAGFSYTGTGTGYCHDTHSCVARNLYSALQQFYTLFPHLMSTPLWITGESYGGHYVPAIAAYIDTQNARLSHSGSPPKDVAHQLVFPEVALPLAGIAVGDGWVDPVNMLSAYGAMMFNQGLLSEPEQKDVETFMAQAATLIQQGDFLGSFNVWDKFLNGDIYPYANWFHNHTGLNDYDNYMNTDPPKDLEYYHQFLSVPAVRTALHVGDHVLQSGHDCEMALLSDFMASLADEIVQLMNQPDKYRVVLYSGQLDVIIGAALTEAFLQLLPWNRKSDYLAADKSVWRIDPSDSDVAGYVREVGNFSQVIIRGAGHLCPHDQPERSLSMIVHAVDGIPYVNQPNPTEPHGDEL